MTMRPVQIWGSGKFSAYKSFFHTSKSEEWNKPLGTSSKEACLFNNEKKDKVFIFVNCSDFETDIFLVYGEMDQSETGKGN